MTRVKIEIHKEMKDFYEFRENGYTSYPNLSNTMTVASLAKRSSKFVKACSPHIQ